VKRSLFESNLQTTTVIHDHFSPLLFVIWSNYGLFPKKLYLKIKSQTSD